MTVDTSLLKQLRDATQAPFKDCKEALQETGNDIDKAQEYLKEKGAAVAQKKAGRETNEGILKSKEFDDKVIGIKLGCETDFVAKSDLFYELVSNLLDSLYEYGNDFENIEDLDDNFIENNLNPIINEYIGKIGENIKLLDAFATSKKPLVYEHPGNKVMAVVYYTSDDYEQGKQTAKEIALQIAAMNPYYSKIGYISEDEKDNLKNSFKENIDLSGKPEDVQDKIIEGKLGKHYSEIVLMEQSFIKDDTKQVKDIIPEGFELKSFKRFSI